MTNKKIGERIIRHFKLTKFALYKFLGKFIPYFKNKIMNYVKKEDIIKNIGNKLSKTLNDNGINIDLDANSYKGVAYSASNNLEKISLYYIIDKINALILNLEYHSYNSVDFNFSVKDNGNVCLKDAEKLLVLDNVFNNNKVKAEFIEYFKSIIVVN